MNGGSEDLNSLTKEQSVYIDPICHIFNPHSHFRIELKKIKIFEHFSK